MCSRRCGSLVPCLWRCLTQGNTPMGLGTLSSPRFVTPMEQLGEFFPICPLSRLSPLPSLLDCAPLRDCFSLHCRLTPHSATLIRSSAPLSHVPRRAHPSLLRSSCKAVVCNIIRFPLHLRIPNASATLLGTPFSLVPAFSSTFFY